jgi:hypothetical protein
MKLTQELIDQIQEAMLHTNLKGEINWKDGDDIEVNLAGTFAKDKFIVIKNKSKDPVVSALPHPHFDYEKEADTVAIIRTLIFLQLVITNCFIVAGNIRHWNDHYTPPHYEHFCDRS